MNTVYLCVMFIVGMIGFSIGANVGPQGVQAGMTAITFMCMAVLIIDFVFNKIYPAVVGELADREGDLPRKKRALHVVIFDAETKEAVSECTSYDFMPEDRKKFSERKWNRLQKREAKES